MKEVDLSHMKRLTAVYSNFDHVLNVSIAAHLMDEPNKVWAPHYAQEFRGEIWFDGKFYNSQIRRHHVVISMFQSRHLIDVINGPNELYGKD